MSGQSVIRLISVVFLQGMLLYELFGIQSASLRWYEWAILTVLTIGMAISLIAECTIDEYDKSEYKDNYVIIRIINALILCGLLWKTFSIQSELPISLTWTLIAIFGIGLFSIFNFLYYLVALLTTGCVFFALTKTNHEGFWQYIITTVVIIVGVATMIGIMAEVENRKAAERRAAEEARKRREAEAARRRTEEEARNRANDNLYGHVIGGAVRAVLSWMLN